MLVFPVVVGAGRRLFDGDVALKRTVAGAQPPESGTVILTHHRA